MIKNSGVKLGGDYKSDLEATKDTEIGCMKGIRRPLESGSLKPLTEPIKAKKPKVKDIEDLLPQLDADQESEIRSFRKDERESGS